MPKYPKRQIDKNDHDRLLLEFCHALTVIKKPEEAADFLRDLLGPHELEMFAIRLQIAKFLQKNLTYEAIRKKLNVGYTTIARVAAWLSLQGDGFRLVLSRIEEVMPGGISQKSTWTSIKRRYPTYFWPELLLEEIVKSASKRQRKRMEVILGTLKQSKIKLPLFRQLNRLMANFSQNTKV